MTAAANRTKESENSLMAPMAEKVSEGVTNIMMLFGIKSIKCQKLNSAEYSRLMTSVEMFDEVPESVKMCGVLVKDAIAELLASVGIIEIELKADDNDRKILAGNYEALVKRYNSLNTESISIPVSPEGNSPAGEMRMEPSGTETVEIPLPDEVRERLAKKSKSRKKE